MGDEASATVQLQPPGTLASPAHGAASAPAPQDGPSRAVKHAAAVDADADGLGEDGKPKKKEKEPTVSLGTLLRYTTCADYTLFAFGVVAAVGNGLTMPAFSLVFGELLDSFNPASDVDIMDEVSKFALWISLAGVAAWVFSYIEIAFFNIAAERQAKFIRDRYFAALVNQDIGWFDQQTTEAIVTKVADETRTIRDGLGDKLGLGFRQLVTFIGGFVLAFVEGWQLTLILLVMAPLLAIAGHLMMTMMADVEAASAKLYAKAGAIAQERLAAVRTVQAFGGQRQALADYGAQLDGTCKAGTKKGFLEGAGMAFTMFVMFVMYGLAFWFGSKLIADDREDVLAVLSGSGCAAEPDFSVTCSAAWELSEGPTCASLCKTVVEPCLAGDTCHTGGNIVLVFFSVIIGAMAIGQTTPSATALAKAQAAGYQVFSVIDRAVPIDAASKEGTKVQKAGVQGRIVLRDVHFSYPSRPDRKVLDGLNLTIEPGSTVALVGRSGCGKSTVVSLIQRFYDPDSGTVELDDLGALTRLNLRSLRDVMGLVGQEPVLFQTSVRENIKLGTTETVTDQDVEAAARMANAHDFIMEFKDNYDTDVGERGAALSGGQKQRVAIARALIRKPKLLLLDEATSALDSQSEQVVQEALNTIMASRSHTTVVIAHRLSTIKSADKIVVLDKGKVIEEGTHETLMEIQDGVYRDLVEAQMSGRDGALAELSDEEEGKVTAYNGGEDETKDGPGSPGRSRSRSRSRSRARTMSRARTGSIPGKKGEQEDEEPDDPDVDTSIMRVFRLSAREWPWIALGMVSAAVNGSVFPLFAVAFSEIITIFYEPRVQVMRDDGVYWAIAFVLLAVVAALCAIGMFGSFGVTGNRLAKRLRAMAFEAMLYKDMAYHDDERHNTGVLTTQLATDATLVDSMASQRSAVTAQNIVTMIVGLLIAFLADWRLSLVVLACGPVIALSGHMQMKMFIGQNSNAQASLEEAGHVVEETVHGIRTVAAFNLGEEMALRYRNRLVLPQKQGIKGGHIAGVGFGFSQFVMFASYGLCFYVGGLWVQDGSLSFNDMLTVLMAIMMTATGLGQSNTMMPDAAKAKRAIKNIFTLLDKTPAIDCTMKAGGTVPARVEGHIQFKDIVFEYPTREGRVLNHVSLDVPAGTSVALVGSSGSGKSTLVQLMQRFYDPVNPEGAVLLDGVNLKNINVHWLRQQIGIVSQEPTLFNGTVADNIKYGLVAESDNPDLGENVSVPLIDGDTAGDDEPENSAPRRGTHLVPAAIVRAAKDANAHDFIIRMQDGYHTVIKPDSLSGGQKQRVAIARAILRKPPILLLDEATSALDNRSEHIVQQALDALIADKNTQRTTIVIAHRLSTIYRSDHIVVMHKGEIVEQGTHDFLTSDQAPYGKYRTMWEQQSLLAKANGKK